MRILPSGMFNFHGDCILDANDLVFYMEKRQVSVEVTPEMIEAGIEAMWDFELDGFNREEWRRAIEAGFTAAFAKP